MLNVPFVSSLVYQWRVICCQLKQLKLDLHDVLYSHKWTPDAYLLARAYVADEIDRPLCIGEALPTVASTSVPRIPLRYITKKL